MLPINDPIVVAEVTAAFRAYEAALLANDVPTLQSFFWRSPESVRFGATEQLYGYEAIAAFRQGRVVNFARRQGVKLSVTTFGCSFASAMYEYTAQIDAAERQGRQSQTWVKFDDAWRIVAAHISLTASEPSPAEFALTALATHRLKPDPEWENRIQTLFAATAAIAEPLMRFSLPADLEPAPIFEP